VLGDHMAQGCDEQLLLAREIKAHDALRQLGLACHVGERRAREAVPGDRVDGRLDQLDPPHVLDVPARHCDSCVLLCSPLISLPYFRLIGQTINRDPHSNVVPVKAGIQGQATSLSFWSPGEMTTLAEPIPKTLRVLRASA